MLRSTYCLQISIIYDDAYILKALWTLHINTMVHNSAVYIRLSIAFIYLSYLFMGKNEMPKCALSLTYKLSNRYLLTM